MIIKDFYFLGGFPIFYFLSKMALDPPTAKFFFGCLDFFLALQHPLVRRYVRRTFNILNIRKSEKIM